MSLVNNLKTELEKFNQQIRPGGGLRSLAELPPAQGKLLTKNVSIITTEADKIGTAGDNWDETTVAAYHSAATTTAAAAASSYDKINDGIKKDSPILVAQGILDFVAAASAFGVAAGPPGILAAAVIGSVCILASGILGHIYKAKHPQPSMEQILREVLEEALQKVVDTQLRARGQGLVSSLSARLQVLGHLVTESVVVVPPDGSDNDGNLVKSGDGTFAASSGREAKTDDASSPDGGVAVDRLSKIARAHIADPSYLYDGVEFLEILFLNIQETEPKYGVSGAQLLYFYAKIAWLRIQMLLQLAFLYSWNDAAALSETAFSMASKQWESDKRRFPELLARPKTMGQVVYAHTAVLDDEKRAFVEEYFGKRYGVPVRLKLLNKPGFYLAWNATKFSIEAVIEDSKEFKKATRNEIDKARKSLLQRARFLRFEVKDHVLGDLTGYYNDRTLQMFFSVAAGGFLSATDSKSSAIGHYHVEATMPAPDDKHYEIYETQWGPTISRKSWSTPFDLENQKFFQYLKAEPQNDGTPGKVYLSKKHNPDDCQWVQEEA